MSPTNGTDREALIRPIELGRHPLGSTYPAKSHVSMACYRDEIPNFVERALEDIYANVFSTIPYYRLHGDTDGINTFVARRGNQIISVLLFRVENARVRVINEQIDISEEEIERFARYIFDYFSNVKMICFHAVHAEMQKLAFPYQRFECSEDIVAYLPATPEEYLAKLGPSTRKNIKNRLNKLKSSFPSFEHRVSVAGEIDEQQARDLIELNRKRMVVKSKVPGIDQEDANRIIALAKLGGLVSAVLIDGRVCAGTICFRTGKNYFSRVNAHDPEYDSYRLGTIANYLGICACIKQGGKEFHFLWGRNDYKYTLLGVHHDLHHVAIYRSRKHCFISANAFLRVALNGYSHQMRTWLLEKAKKQENPSLSSRLAFQSLDRLRKLKRAASVLRGQRN